MLFLLLRSLLPDLPTQMRHSDGLTAWTMELLMPGEVLLGDDLFAINIGLLHVPPEQTEAYHWEHRALGPKCRRQLSSEL